MDADRRVRPAPDAPWLTGKLTYWESNGQLTRRVAVPALALQAK